MTRAQRARAVIVEDDEDIRALEAAVLQGDDWEVVTAATGQDGVDLVRATLPDVVICDLMLPDFDGTDVIRNLLDDPATADIPVILVSAMGDDSHVAAGIDAGALDYLAKPFAPVQLQARCRSALRVRRNHVSLVAAQSEMRTLHDSLVETESIQRASLDALEQGVALVSVEREVKLLNKAGERILGYSADELSTLFQGGSWETYREDGTVMPAAERPITHTMLTGLGVSNEIVCWRTPSGRMVTLRVATEPLLDADGQTTALVIAFADITAQRAAERAERAAVEQLAWEASHDSLTGLANRSMLLERLGDRLADPRSSRTALLYVDLDHFKNVNDTFGHDTGDELLVVTARRLEQAVRPTDLVTRYGGDEFLVLVAVEEDDDADVIAERILRRLASPVALSCGELTTSASIGLAHARDADVDALIRDADIALLRAKRDGRARVATMALAD